MRKLDRRRFSPDLHSDIRRMAFVVPILFLLFSIDAGSVEAQSSRSRKVSLQTVRLDPPIGKVQQITLRGTLGSTGEVTLDENQWTTPNQFGDSQPITEAFFPPIAVRFRQLKLADPSGKRRKVYELDGKLTLGDSRMYLVSPSRKSGTYRLVISAKGKERRVVTLEQRADAAPKSQRIPKIVKIDYSVLKSNPPTLVVTATGEVPTGGWSNPQLVRRVYVVPPADGIWEYDLTAEPPTGIATQVITKLKATNRWHDFNQGVVKGIRVYGVGRGIKEVIFPNK